MCIKLFDVRKWFRHIEYAVDGIIVGDGRHDFTKIYKEYEMNISGKPFVLIDVPGIEGNEDDYKDFFLDESFFINNLIIYKKVLFFVVIYHCFQS